jgi:hypothetical protein
MPESNTSSGIDRGNEVKKSGESKTNSIKENSKDNQQSD